MDSSFIRSSVSSWQINIFIFVLCVICLQVFDKVIENRTFSIVAAVEGIVDTGNFFAVARSAEALGIHSLHK